MRTYVPLLPRRRPAARTAAPAVVAPAARAPGLPLRGFGDVPLQAPVLRRKLSFKDCKTKVKGQEDAQETTLRQAAADAKGLAKAALDRLTGVLLADAEALAAFEANFGKHSPDREKAVTKVFKAIVGSLDNKNFICIGECKKTKDEIACALASAGNDDIQICPSFFVDPCAKIQPAALVHESAHNAGAGGDHDKPRPKDKKKVAYPPAKGEDNAYSYHHFVEDLRDRTFDIKPVGTQPKEVEVQPSK